LIPAGFSRLLGREEIDRRVHELAAELRADLAGRPITFVGILDGALFFMTDLIRALGLDIHIDFLRISSYRGGAESGDLRMLSGLTWNIAGQDVVIVDDILDSGKTITFCERYLKSLGANSVRCVLLLAKERACDIVLEKRYVGFTIPDRFVIGYGLDWNGRYRHLPEIYSRESE
jgi:hypoxanthine phosphoribosyltransferase